MSKKKRIWTKVISLISLLLPSFNAQGHEVAFNTFLNDIPSQKPPLFLNPVGYLKNFLFASHSSHRSHSSHSSHRSGSYHRSHVSHTSAQSGYHSSHVSHTSSYGSSSASPNSNSSSSSKNLSPSLDSPRSQNYESESKEIQGIKYNVTLANGSSFNAVTCNFDKQKEKLNVILQGEMKVGFYLKDITSITETSTGKVVYKINNKK